MLEQSVSYVYYAASSFLMSFSIRGEDLRQYMVGQRYMCVMMQWMIRLTEPRF